ncbi:MAG: YggT family protein [Pseudomonadales bacterium]|nr:YggT family protein [Pseudomonadales bacterium]NIX07600.1 YggT family protein [Pseudomonadales bacterium]
MAEVLYYVTSFILQVVAFLFVVRFLLQACRADFYNPISQGIVKATDVVLKPVRMVLPGYRNLDFAALLAALIVEVVMIVALGAISGRATGTALQILSSGVLQMVLLGLFIIKWSILIVIIASFLAPGNYHPALALLQQLTEPVLAPARKLLPPMGGLDFSPILVFLILGVIERILLQI